MAKLDRPQLRVGGLSQKVYVITHGKIVERKEGGSYLDASRKYDVHEQFETVARELGWKPPSS